MISSVLLKISMGTGPHECPPSQNGLTAGCPCQWLHYPFTCGLGLRCYNGYECPCSGPDDQQACSWPRQQWIARVFLPRGPKSMAMPCAFRRSNRTSPWLLMLATRTRFWISRSSRWMFTVAWLRIWTGESASFAGGQVQSLSFRHGPVSVRCGAASSIYQLFNRKVL